MSHTVNEADQKVAALLKEWCITSRATIISTGCKDESNDNWEHDAFNIMFQKGTRSPVTFDYKMGLGNRFNDFKQFFSSPSTVRDYIKDLRALYDVDQSFPVSRVIKNTMEKENYLSKVRKPCNAYVFVPTQANVLYCLLSDMEAIEYTFDDWCANFGYDTDSRKAEKIFHACMEEGKKLLKIFTKDQIEELREVLQDY